MNYFVYGSFWNLVESPGVLYPEKFASQEVS